MTVENPTKKNSSCRKAALFENGYQRDINY